MLFREQCRSAGIPMPIEQRRFALSIERQWRFDFCWPECMVAVEIDGGVWRRGGGAHSHPLDILRNMTKRNDAALLGWRVLSFTTDEVTKSLHAIEFTVRVLRSVPSAVAHPELRSAE